ncbi:class I SAM-dependent methyltransferase [Actinokineospora soli]|uniref:Class I SAM-dependent methyltransferase n=1 Tax=Actinokineospora soli TaxID=1048753 RepID=A0ABW2TZQ7_9PSEU
MYSDADAAALYDVLNAWAASDDFYLAHVMAAGSALDVGCGTGVLLHRARDAGHRGRLTGIDPDRAALERARRRADVEWVDGRAVDIPWRGEFDVAVMASNAFQCLVTDDEIAASLAKIRTALVDGGRFVFETRNPAYRQWTEWRPENAVDVVDHAGRALRIAHRVESVADGVVTFTETTATPDGDVLRVDRASLRFLEPDELRGFLADAGFRVARLGDWDGGPLTERSKSIVVVAEPGSAPGR